MYFEDMVMDPANRHDDDQSVLQLLHRASQSAEDLLAQHLTRAGVTPRQLTVLRAAASIQSASQTALVSQTGIDRSTLADIVRRLVEAGLVRRERTEADARMYAIEVTETGTRLLADLAPEVGSVSQHILDLVEEPDRPALLRALKAIVENLGPVASARVSERAKSLRIMAEAQAKMPGSNSAAPPVPSPMDPTDMSGGEDLRPGNDKP